MAINFLGLISTFWIIQRDLNIHNFFSEKICCKTNSKCDNSTPQIIKRYGIPSFGVIGFSFFLTNISVSTFIPLLEYPLFVLSLLSLIFVIWSICYQAFKKHWCTLCILTVSITTINSAILYYNVFPNIKPRIESIFQFAILLSLYFCIIIFINRIKGMLSLMQKNRYWKSKYIDLKYESNFIKSTLDSFQYVEKGEITKYSMHFGNKQSSYKIILVANLQCRPCGQLHDIIANAININEIDLNIILSPSHNCEELNRLCLQFYSTYGPGLTWEMLSEWYNDNTIHKIDFFHRYKLRINGSVKQIYEYQCKWIKSNNISETPSIIINSRIIKSPFAITDYKYLIDV